MYSKKIKDFESIEETQKIKSSNDMDGEEVVETLVKNNNKSLLIIIIVLLLFFVLIVFLFFNLLNKVHARLNSSFIPQVQQIQQITQNLDSRNNTNNKNILSQPEKLNENQINLTNPIPKNTLNFTLIPTNKKKQYTNISFEELLPKTKKRGETNNISEILKSKILFISNKKITNEYIQFVKPLNETIENKYRQILFPNLAFDNYLFPHKHNYSIYLSYLQKSSRKNSINKNKNQISKTINKNNITVNRKNNNTNFPIHIINNFINQSLSNSVNNVNNKTLSYQAISANNVSLSNPFYSANYQSLSILMNNVKNQSTSNPTNDVNNHPSSNLVNNTYNKSSSIPLNRANNKSLSNTFYNAISKFLKNPVYNENNQPSSNSINNNNNQSLSNPINSVKNKNSNYSMNSINNLKNQINNTLINITHNLRNLIANESNSSYLRDFYLACDRKKLFKVRKNKSESYEEPIISIIIPFFNKKLEFLRTIRSIQLQTLKNIEIIIVDDEATSTKEYYKHILDSDFRIRLFTQNKNMGLWKKRIDGFLYSRGEYILHINPGDILSDSFVLDDLNNLVHRYNLDTVRFSFSKTIYDSKFKRNIVFNQNKIYPNIFTKILYGRPGYNVHIFGYGTIWNRLVRSGIFRKALDLVDEDLLNIHKDLWEDMWWNDLVDRVSFSNLVVNRFGYTNLYDINNEYVPRSNDKYLREKTIHEFILFWLFDLKLMPKNDNKQKIINNILNFIKPENTFGGVRVSLQNLINRFEPYELLLLNLIEDPFVNSKNKDFLKKIYEEAIKSK